VEKWIYEKSNEKSKERITHVVDNFVEKI